MCLDDAVRVVLNDLLVRNHNALHAGDTGEAAFLYGAIGNLRGAYPDISAEVFGAPTAPAQPAATPDKPA